VNSSAVGVSETSRTSGMAQALHRLRNRVDRFLERHFPERLYARSLIIVVTPVVALQLIMTYMFMERHYETVTRSLAESYISEVVLLISLYNRSDQGPEARDRILAMANQDLKLRLSILENQSLPEPIPSPAFSSVDRKLRRYVWDNLKLPFWLDTIGTPNFVDLRIEVKPHTVFRFVTPIARAHAPTRPLFLFAMVSSSLVLLSLAIIFLRGQIRPILRLAEAAQAFGMGRDVANFRPSGAREIQEASNAFIMMKARIERNVEQRTAMLAGVSHDLRTVLTRLNLELALMPETAATAAMREDVAEMQRMLEGYLSFARGDGGEESRETDIVNLVTQIGEDFARSGRSITVKLPDSLMASVKPQALKRCIANLVANAIRFGKLVTVTGSLEDRALTIMVEDDGPGVPSERYADVFKPFVRLDDARNQDTPGTGLGLAIALDVARSHGGDIALGRSAAGGLEATVTIPQ
jgi:two-component system, OmpR family, osmolarity sensor histidine kinase EnvZ